MTATTTDRLDGLASSTAVKGPCKAASTTNLTLSGAQTVNAVSIVADDRVLVTGQTDGTENGIYVASTGAWRRAKDFSSNNDIRTGAQVRVNSGTNAGIWVLTTADPVTIDTSTITFTRDTALTGGALMAANNLSDVASAVAALWNLRNNGADIPSAATLNLDNATGDQVDVTGAVTITAVTLAEDREVWVRFTGAPQITVGASLIGNAGGANITMAAGDIARFRGYAAGVVRFTVFPLAGAISRAGDTMVGALLAAVGSAAAPGLAFSGDADSGWYRAAANSIAAAVAGAKVLGITATGIDLVGLLDLAAATSGQIKFPAAQNPSADANTLDDYEEGTWTPALAFGGATTGITYSGQAGYYTKIGRVVHLYGAMTLTSNGSASGAATITGAPFANGLAFGAPGYIGAYSNFSGIVGGVCCQLPGSSSTIQLFNGNAATAPALTDTQITNTASFPFFITYFAA